MIIIFFWFPIILIISLGILHIYWGFGGELWKNKVLPEYKYNFKPQLFKQTPSSFMCFLVATALLSIATLQICFQYKIGNPEFISVVLKLVCLALAGRIIGEFNCLGLFKRERDTKFAKMDNMIYIPICGYLLISLIIQLSGNINRL